MNTEDGVIKAGVMKVWLLPPPQLTSIAEQPIINVANAKPPLQSSMKRSPPFGSFDLYGT
jgi:hypothetical protein